MLFCSLPLPALVTARFDYWASFFKYLRAMAQTASAAGALSASLAKAASIQDMSQLSAFLTADTIPKRVVLVNVARELMNNLSAIVSTTGSMGTVCDGVCVCVCVCVCVYVECV